MRNTHWSELNKWSESQKEQRSEALMAALQDQVSGEQAELGPLQKSIYSLAHESLPWFLIV